ncbi:MFS transporter [Spirochaeta africana]|uniref:Major Facilitator Superfamily transporter n=1 Tax=Spirochaeta africana (strain ATCC 700263 / DSM 8902 / Z-7692) TaxID=889378 RepID=H9UIJ4_SPIAZ|nr:MFS transporter [Spirochaeta africana]AFG37337.1 Major Facilitator Superfamily transporter [Spirochaeta africana DSM 8902]
MHRAVIRPYLLYRFFQDFALVYPVYVIYFQQTGLDYQAIAVLLAGWAAAMLVMEIPSGILADLSSRRLSIAAGMVMKAAAFLVWMYFPVFSGFMLGFVLWGCQEAITTGTADALLYDALRATGDQQQYIRLAGRGTLASRAGIVLSVLTGAVLFSVSTTAVLLVSSLSMLISAAAAVCIPEKQHSSHVHPDVRSRLGIIRQQLMAAMQIPGLLSYVVFGSLVTAVYGILDEYDFLYAAYRGVPLAAVGIWGTIRFLSEGVGAWAADWLEQWVSVSRPPRLALWSLAAALLLSGGIVLGGLQAPASVVVLPLYFLYFGAMAAAEVVVSGRVQHVIQSEGRATISSVVSFVYTGFGIIVGLAFGWAASSFGLPAIFLSGAIITATAASIYLSGIGITTVFRHAR